MNCKHCNAQINDGSLFCSVCGQKVELETPQTNITQKKELYCNYCNNKIPDDSVFCPVCGKRIPEDQRIYKTNPVVNNNSLQSNNVEQSNFSQGQQYYGQPNQPYENNGDNIQQPYYQQPPQGYNTNVPTKQNKVLDFCKSKKGIICLGSAVGVFILIVVIIAVCLGNSPAKKGYKIFLKQCAEEANMSVREFKKTNVIDSVYCVYQDDFYCYKVSLITGDTVYFHYTKGEDEVGTYSARYLYNDMYDDYELGEAKYKKIV